MDINQWFGPISDISFSSFAVAMLVSLAASLAAWAMYVIFYRDWDRGAGVYRTFLLAGPAITVLFVAIQNSLPLSLGLLGALSFVRFRTPVKDPAEIGYLLLVIASSISAATYNYEMIGLLFAIAFAVLVLQRFLGGSSLRSLLPSGRDLIVTMPAADYTEHEAVLLEFLGANLQGMKHESSSQNAETSSLHVRFRSSNYDNRWGEFQTALAEAIAPAQAEVYVG